MKLAAFARQHAKLLWGVGGAVGVAGVLYAATRSSGAKKTNGGGGVLLTGPSQIMATALAPDSSSGRWAMKNQRVMAWPRTTDVDGQVYIKFTDGTHVRGGWIDETSIQRDADIAVLTPDEMANAIAKIGLSAGGGGGGGGNVQQVQPVAPSGPNAVVLADSYMFTTSGGKTRLNQLITQLQYVFDTLTSGKGVFVDEATFRKIYTHQGAKVLDLIAGDVFYKDGQYSFDNLTNHAWCQTYAAEVVGLGNDWLWPYYNQSMYRYGPNVTPDAGLDRYPNSPIDPIKDNAAFQAAVSDAIETNIQAALHNSSLGAILGEMADLTGLDLSALYGGLAKLGYMIEITPQTRDYLVRYARDTVNKAVKDDPKKNKPLPTTDADGQPIPADRLLQLHAAAGALFAGGVIDMFETDNTDDKKGVVNPCIRELDAGTVLSMIATVVGLFLTIVSLGTAGAFGVAISAISFVYNVQADIQKLAALSK